MAVKKKVVTKDTNLKDVKVYRCSKCGSEHLNPNGKFYKSTWSHLWDANDKYCSVCKDCLDELFKDYSRRYNSDKTALMIICHYLDIPFYYSLYDSLVMNNSNFSVGMYTRLILNQRQYQYKTFVNSLIDPKELLLDKGKHEEQKETKWSNSEYRNKNEAIKIIGYDPFEGYDSDSRRFLFGELIKYFDDDIADDTFKLSQVIQIVNNNNQIRQYDLVISSLNPIKDANDIKILNGLKKDLVSSNDKIAKENEISVKNRSNKDIGKSTLTFLMKDLREKDIKGAEANYYDQLTSVGTQWAADMSLKAIKQNTFFDENDKNDVFTKQRSMIDALQAQVDDLLEKNRLLTIDNNELKGKKKNGS